MLNVTDFPTVTFSSLSIVTEAYRLFNHKHLAVTRVCVYTHYTVSLQESDL